MSMSRDNFTRDSIIHNSDGLGEYEMLQLLDEGVKKRGVSDRKLRSLRVRSVDRRLVTREKCHVCQFAYEHADQVSVHVFLVCYKADVICDLFVAY
jgi:hypothetical protein